MKEKSVKTGKSILGAVIVTLLIASALPIVGLAADPVNIVASVSNNDVAVGDTLVYEVVLSGAASSMPDPDVTIPSHFRILTGPRSSLNVQWVNGRMSATRTVSWVLQAVVAGEVSIPAPTAVHRRNTYAGPEVRLKINPDAGSGSRSGGGTSGRQSSSAAPTNPARSQRRPGGLSDIGTRDDPVFIDVEIEPRDVYVQQPIVATYTLYFSERVTGYDIRRFSSTEGFWTEPLERPDRPSTYSTTINGKSYQAAMIYKLLLFPTQSGDLTIGPMEMVCQVQRRSSRGRSRGLLDDFFGGDPFGGAFGMNFEPPQPVDMATEPVTIQVRPLPAEGRPARFDNVVGNFQIAAALDQDSVETNESVTLTVTISGSGNIGFIPEPQFNVPPDIEMYDPQTDTKQNATSSSMRGHKTFRYLLIPRRPGAQPIPAISFSFFDPERAQYRTVSTDPKTLYVRPASGWSAAASDLPGGTADAVRSIGTDIRWIHDSTKGLRQLGTPLYQRAVYPVAYLVPLLVMLGSWIGSRRMRDLQKDARSRKAARRAMLALKEARDAHKAGQIAEGYDALARGLYHYIADRIHRPAPELNQRLIDEVLAERKVSQDNRTRILSILQRCDTARFTPAGTSPDTLLELIGEAQAWVLEVDKRLENGKK